MAFKDTRGRPWAWEEEVFAMTLCKRVVDKKIMLCVRGLVSNHACVRKELVSLPYLCKRGVGRQPCLCKEGVDN